MSEHMLKSGDNGCSILHSSLRSCHLCECGRAAIMSQHRALCACLMQLEQCWSLASKASADVYFVDVCEVTAGKLGKLSEAALALAVQAPYETVHVPTLTILRCYMLQDAQAFAAS